MVSDVTFRATFWSRCRPVFERPTPKDGKKGGRLSGATRWSVDEMIYEIVCIKLHARTSTTCSYIIRDASGTNIVDFTGTIDVEHIYRN